MFNREREFTGPDGLTWVASLTQGSVPPTSGEGAAPVEMPGIWFRCTTTDQRGFHPMRRVDDLPTLREFDAFDNDQLIKWWKSAVWLPE